MHTCTQLVNSTLTRFGIDVGRCDLIVHVKICKGFVRHADGSVQRQLAAEEANFPLQVSSCVCACLGGCACVCVCVCVLDVLL
jgi:hypothetical protein